MRLLILAAVLLARPGVSRADPIRPQPSRDAGLFTLLDRDPRLRTRITMERLPGSTWAVLRQISQKTGVQIICQGDFLLKPPTVSAVKDLEAREVMTQIALGTRGVWLHRNGIYRLMENGIDLQHFEVGGAVGRANEAATRLRNSLTPAQWDVLRSGKPLVFRQLNQDQQSWFALALHLEYSRSPQLDPGLRHRILARTYLRLDASGNGGTALLSLCGPYRDTDGLVSDGTLLMVSVRDASRLPDSRR